VSKSLFEVEGFEDLQKQLMRFSDGVKRKELLKILGQVANPTLKAAQTLVPVGGKKHTRYVGVKKGVRRGNGTVKSSDKIEYQPGNLKKSLKKIVAKRSKVNPRLDVGAKAARSRGKKPDGYYAHMLVKKGFKGIGGRVNANRDFLNDAFNQTKGRVTADAEKRVSRYLQKQIDRLSKTSSSSLSSRSSRGGQSVKGFKPRF
jgi:hypothetical protein